MALISEKEFAEVSKLLYEESDRGCVLIAEAILDNCLVDILKGEFKVRSDLNHDDREDLVVGRFALIGTFSAHITIAHAFGLIDRPMKTALDALRSIRNKAAHTKQRFLVDDYREKINDILAPLVEPEMKILFSVLKSEPVSVAGSIGSGADCQPVRAPSARSLLRMGSLLLFLRLCDRAYDPNGRGYLTKIEEIWKEYAAHFGEDEPAQSKSSDPIN
jgi:hypothetical protein